MTAAGRRHEFDAWLSQLQEAQRARPGYRDSPVLLEQTGGIVHLLTRFASRSDLDAWEASTRCGALTTAADRFSIHRRDAAIGNRPRFILPNDASARGRRACPSGRRTVGRW